MEKIKTALITGTTGAIGFGIAKLIAQFPNYKVVILARNENKAKQAVEELRKLTGNKNISFILYNLLQKQEIIDVANNWKGALDILINDAGTTPRKREVTPEGIEMQWATNVLGYFWMIKYFTPYLEKSSSARIINVASYWAGDLNFDDLEFKTRHYNNDSAYRQSKQADRMLTVAFAERLKPIGITVNACHPSDVRSTLASNLGYGGQETPEEAAATPVWLATSNEVERITAKYFEHKRETICRFGMQKEQVEKLFKICESY
jgi:NAD(P)-dependent dehydrogenase (short-subunit alcohol dehydrogenase family)